MKTAIPYFLLIFTFVLLSSCSDREFDNPASTGGGAVEQNTDLKQGWELLTNGELDAALAKFEAVLKQDPKNVDAHVGASGIYLAKNDFQRAIDSSKAALENAPIGYTASFDSTIDRNQIHLTLAQAYYYMGDFNRSNDQVRQLTGKNVILSPVSLIQEIERLGQK